MKELFSRLFYYIGSIKARWWFVYVGFAVLVYLRLFGFFGTVGLTAILILLHNKIDEIGY